MKNKILSTFSIALLFVANPGLIFAEEIISNNPIIEENSDSIEIENTNTASSSETYLTETTEESTTTSDINNSDLETLNGQEISVTVNIRYNDSVIFSGPVNLIANGTTTITDNTNTVREIFSDTALGALKQTDIVSDDFSISNLAYYSSFDSFLINCLEVTTNDQGSIDACYNWQYIVNDSYPFVGVDKYDLTEGDNVYFYFGSPRIIELSTTTIFSGDSVIATAKKYDYKNNLYVPLNNYVIGLTQPDPNNPWSPTVLFATSSNEFGQVTFQINTPGSYGIGLESDYYYPVYNVNVLATTSTSTTTNANSGGGSNNSSDKKIDIEKAIEFLISNQKTNGSFGSDLYTDWASIALFSTDESSAKNSVKNYLKLDKISSSVTTDFERRAMALMSAGINPYSGTDVNYISEIIETFDGNQFGDSDLINDDIFAILPLINAGYKSSDQEIKKVVAFLISKQNSNGSFENVDLTAAAIQALALVKNLPEVNSSITKAKAYLKSQQEDDGGFGNTFATLWVMQAISALGEDFDDWSKVNNNPLDYIASKQSQDGGLNIELDINSRIWATSYLIPAYYEKTWNDIMQNFSKQDIETSSNNTTSQNTSSSSVTNYSEENFIDSGETMATSTVKNLANEESLIPKTLNIANAEISTDQLIKGLEQVVKGELNSDELAKKIVTGAKDNLQANALGSLNESGLISFFTDTIEQIVQKILAGTSTLLGAVFSLFNF